MRKHIEHLARTRRNYKAHILGNGFAFEDFCNFHHIHICGDYSVATKPKYVEILDFKHFVKHTVFNLDGDKFRNKEIKNYVVVKVVIDMVCGDTKKP